MIYIWPVAALSWSDMKFILHNNLYSFLPVENGVIKSQSVYAAMLATDRAHYTNYFPYMDSPQSIGKITNYCQLIKKYCIC